MIQKPFLGKKNLAHARFNFYWPVETYDQKNNCVLIVVKKYLLNKIVVKYQTDLVSHPYGMVLDITDGKIYGKRKKKKTRIVNIYDNKLEERQIW